MRKLRIGMLGGLTALLGFAGAAHAAETISLIWQSTGTNAIINPRPSDLLVLDVIVNADATDGSRGGEISIDYTNVGLDPNKLVFVTSTSDPDGFFAGLDLIPTVDNGTAVTGLGTLNTGDAVNCVAASCRLATITFHKEADITPFITLQSFYSPGEGVDFLPPTSACGPGTCGPGFGTATLFNLPDECTIEKRCSVRGSEPQTSCTAEPGEEVTYTYDFFDSGGGTALIIDDKLGLIGETGRETLSRTTTLTETTTNTATFEPISAVCLSGTFFSTVTVTVGTPTPTPTTVTPTPIPPTPTPTTPPDDTAEGSVTRAGGEVSTGDDATASDPVETTVTVPPGTAGGVVAILEGSITETPPTGFSFFGQQVDIVAPDATVHSPLVIAFSVHTSIAGSDPDAVNAFMNGVSIGVCADAGATPDPCIESRSLVGDDIEIIVRTTTASRWNFGMPVPGGADCLCEVQNIQPNQVALKNVGSDGKGSTLNRNMILIVHGVDAPGASCDPGDLSDPTKVELTMVDDDFDLIVFKRGKTIVCNGETTTNVKIGVRFEGPLNCKDSAVPGGGSRAQSVGLITSTGTGSAGTTVYVEATKIRCRSK